MPRKSPIAVEGGGSQIKSGGSSSKGKKVWEANFCGRKGGVRRENRGVAKL